ncbi:MAG TPA: hypothetical protein VGJ15_01535 [Pirellulales bacterium]|jgi:hypothetical protein
MKKSSGRARKRQTAYAVPVRWHESQLEFCLISPRGSSRWEFPHAVTAPGESAAQAACRAMCELTGMVCRLLDRQPLDDALALSDTEPARSGKERSRPAKANPRAAKERLRTAKESASANKDISPVAAFLLRVEKAGAAKSCRIRWCLAEEARARIRRKPLRRLIDLALRHQKAE